MISPQILGLGTDLVSAQSKEHPHSKGKHTPKQLGSLMFMFWLKLHVPFGSGLSPNAPAPIKTPKERAAQLSLCPAFTHTTPALGRKLCPPVTDRKIRHGCPIQTRLSTPPGFLSAHHWGLCDVPHPRSHSSATGSTPNSSSPRC